MVPYVEYLNLIWSWQEIFVGPYLKYLNLIWCWQEVVVASNVKYLNLIWCWQEIVVALYVKYLNLIWCWQVIVHVCHDNHGQLSKGEGYGNKGNQRIGLNWYAWYTKGEILPSGNHLHLKSLKFVGCLDISAK